MNKNLINKEAEDYGWAEMQKLLDKEMPLGGVATIPPQYQEPFLTEKEEKKRRLLPLLWWLGGLLLISAAYFVYTTWLNNQEKTSPQEEKPIYVDKNVEKAEKINTDTGLSGTNNKNKETTLTQNSYKGFLEPNITKQAKINNLLGNKSYTIESVDNQYIKEKRKELFLENQMTQKDDNVVSVNTNSENTISAENTSIVDRTEILNRNIAVVDELHTSSKLMAFDIDPTHNKLTELADLNTLKASPISVFSKNKLKFGAIAGLHTEGVKIIGGYQIGGFVKKKLNSQLPISLQAGLSFRNTNVKGDSVTFVQLDNAAFASSSTPSTTGFQLANGTEVKLENLGYLEIPIWANYNLNSKWNIACGIKAAYLLFNKTSLATWSRLYRVENSTIVGKTAQNDQSSNFVFESSIQALGLNRFDMALLGEISYDFSPNISASLRLDYGANNIMTKKNWAAYNRFLGLNVSYMF